MELFCHLVQMLLCKEATPLFLLLNSHDSLGAHHRGLSFCWVEFCPWIQMYNSQSDLQRINLSLAILGVVRLIPMHHPENFHHPHKCNRKEDYSIYSFLYVNET